VSGPVLAYDLVMARKLGGTASRFEVYALFIAAVVLIGGGIGGAIVVTNDSGTADVSGTALVETTTTVEVATTIVDPPTTEGGTTNSTLYESTPGLTDEQAAWLRDQAQAAIDFENMRLNDPLNIPGCGPRPYPNVPYESGGTFMVDVDFDITEGTVADELTRALGIVMGTCNQYAFSGGGAEPRPWVNPNLPPGYGAEQGGSDIRMMAIGVTRAQLDQALALMGRSASMCERPASGWYCGVTTDEELVALRGW